MCALLFGVAPDGNLSNRYVNAVLSALNARKTEQVIDISLSRAIWTDRPDHTLPIFRRTTTTMLSTNHTIELGMMSPHDHELNSEVIVNAVSGKSSL